MLMCSGRSFAVALAISGLGFTVTMAVPQGQGQKSSATLTKSVEEQGPVAAFDEPELNEPEEQTRRIEKSSRYDKMDLVYDHPDFEVHPRSDHWHLHLTAIPVVESDVEVYGDVVGAKAYLSKDKTGVYSEFRVRVIETLKNDGRSLAINSGGTITLDRVGGSVRFPSGRVERIDVLMHQRLPQVGKQYLFFLKAEDHNAILSILTAYEFRKGQAFALDEVDKFVRLNGADAATLLNTLRNQP